MKQLVIYIHGKGGSVQEAEHYKPFFATNDVIGFDCQAQNPWEAKSEFQDFFTDIERAMILLYWWQIVLVPFLQ